VGLNRALDTKPAANGPQFLDQKALNTRMFPSGHGALDDSPFDELGIVFEARVQVLLGADKLGNCHGTSLQ